LYCNLQESNPSFQGSNVNSQESNAISQESINSSNEQQEYHEKQLNKAEYNISEIDQSSEFSFGSTTNESDSFSTIHIDDIYNPIPRKVRNEKIEPVVDGLIINADLPSIVSSRSINPFGKNNTPINRNGRVKSYPDKFPREKLETLNEHCEHNPKYERAKSFSSIQSENKFSKLRGLPTHNFKNISDGDDILSLITAHTTEKLPVVLNQNPYDSSHPHLRLSFNKDSDDLPNEMLKRSSSGSNENFTLPLHIKRFSIDDFNILNDEKTFCRAKPLSSLFVVDGLLCEDIQIHSTENIIEKNVSIKNKELPAVI
jgi:hypothetical protein